MLKRGLGVSMLAAVAVAAAPSEAAAQVVLLQPVGVTTNMGITVGPPTLTINQSGLSHSYTSGVTDFDDYMALNPTHNTSLTTAWYSGFTVTTGNVDYDLGGTFTITHLALWNSFGGGSAEAIQDFTVFASNDASFASPTNLGSFTALPADPATAGPVQVFSLPATDAEYIRLRIDSNYGNIFSTGFGEAAFGYGSAAVPEPATLALLALTGSAGVLALRRWRQRVAAQAELVQPEL